MSECLSGSDAETGQRFRGGHPSPSCQLRVWPQPHSHTPLCWDCRAGASAGHKPSPPACQLPGRFCRWQAVSRDQKAVKEEVLLPTLGLGEVCSSSRRRSWTGYSAQLRQQASAAIRAFSTAQEQGRPSICWGVGAGGWAITPAPFMLLPLPFFSFVLSAPVNTFLTNSLC